MSAFSVCWPSPFLGLRRAQSSMRELELGTLLRTSSCIAACQSYEAPALVRSFTYDRLLPCPPQQLPLRIEHLFVETSGNLVDIIAESLSLPPRYVRDLIEFGAVYRALRCPEPPENAAPERLELQKKIELLNLPRVQGMSVGESRRPFRVSDWNQHVEAGSYLRVHVHPRRFPRCYEVDWESRIVADEESFVVLDKPPGVSVGGCVDNLEESCATFAARALEMPYPLLITHQIDNCTEGCVVLAKEKEFVSRFNRLLKTRKVSKEYLVLAAAPVPLGAVSHYMQPGRFSPHLLSEVAYDGWHLCQLEVLSCKPLPWPSDALCSRHRIADCGWKFTRYAYECKIKLLTGRTHQVRAQFAALGAPIVGDTIYMPAAIARLESPECDPVLTSGSSWSEGLEQKWIHSHGQHAPELAIGLQACSVSWEGESYTAGLPWWSRS